MFYEERILDGKMWSRNTPDGHWTLVTYEILLARTILAERSLDKALDELVRLRSAHR